MNEENILHTGIGIFVLFVLFLEPYATTRTFVSFLALAGFVGIIGIIGAVSLLVGIFRFLTKGDSIYMSFGLVCIVFMFVVSSWPIDLLFG